jgi:hypothetical protein
MTTVTVPKRKDIWSTATFSASIVWTREFEQRMNTLFGNRVPSFIRDEVLRTIEPYVPLQPKEEAERRKVEPGRLIASAKGDNTTIESDGIYFRWKTPYAVRQFFENPGPGRPTGAKRGKQWTLRWLNDGAGGLLPAMSAKFGFDTTGVLR